MGRKGGLACPEKMPKPSRMGEGTISDVQVAEGVETPASVYELIREDIISGRLNPNERLKVAELAERYATSTNPVREALQQLRGEGFVVMEPNRGARVMPIDENFVRDIIEIEILVEASLTRWFVSIANDADIVELEAIGRDRKEQFRRSAETRAAGYQVPPVHLRPALQPARGGAVVEAPRDPASDQPALSDLAQPPQLGAQGASRPDRGDPRAGCRQGRRSGRGACSGFGPPHHRADGRGNEKQRGLA